MKSKSSWALLLLLLSGIVLGGFIGEMTAKVPGLSWLNFGESFGLNDPLILNLGILVITFGLSIRITMASIINNFNLPFSVGKGDICRIVYLERQERRNVSMEKKNGKTMKGLPISERPYEKVLEKGPVSLSDAELLSVILRSGTKNIPVRDMAEEILNAGNPPGLAGLLHGTVEDYKEIRGVGEVKAIQLACIGELSARIWKAAASEKTIVFDAPSKVAAFYMEEMRHLEQENLKLLLLNTKNILLRDITVSRGTVNASCATPREIYIEALRFRACGIILLHNHPSGDPAPSREDCLFTERVREAGSLMGVPLLDHIIIGDNSYVSLRERGIFET